MKKILVICILAIFTQSFVVYSQTTPTATGETKTVSIGDMARQCVVQVIIEFVPVDIGDSLQISTVYATGSVYKVVDEKSYIALPFHAVDEVVAGREVASMKIILANKKTVTPDSWRCMYYTGSYVDAAFLVIDKKIIGITPISDLVADATPKKGEELTLYCTKNVNGPYFETKHAIYDYFNPRENHVNMDMVEGWGLQHSNSGSIVCSGSGVVGIAVSTETNKPKSAFYVPIGTFQKLFTN